MRVRFDKGNRGFNSHIKPKRKISTDVAASPFSVSADRFDSHKFYKILQYSFQLKKLKTNSVKKVKYKKLVVGSQ